MTYKYNVYTGVQKVRTKTKRYVFGILAALTILGGATAATFAASNNYCGSSDQGCDQAAAVGAQCGSGAASGSFGAFGKGNNLAGGANGPLTGASNSAVCGNSQGNP